MFAWSDNSKSKIMSCDKRIIKVMQELIKVVPFDITVLYGYRSIEKQLELFKQGRIFSEGSWKIVDSAKIVTNCDGVIKKSKHNYKPSRAIDICPYPVNWSDEVKFVELSVIINEISRSLDVDLKWGGYWEGIKDLPHYEI